MALIQWLQAIVPPVLLVCGFPVLIMGCFLLAFQRWLYPKWQILFAVFVAAILAYWLLNGFTRLSHAEIGIFVGVLIPTIGGVILILVSAIQTLRLPGAEKGGNSYGSMPYRSAFYGLMSHSSTSHPSMSYSSMSYGSIPNRPTQLTRVRRALGGACVGGILGLSIGLLVGWIILAIASLFAVPQAVLFDLDAPTLLMRGLLDITIYGLGGIGVGIGLLTGAGWLRMQSMSNRVLIRAVIYSAVMHSVVRRFFQSASLGQSMRQETRQLTQAERVEASQSKQLAMQTTARGDRSFAYESPPTMTGFEVTEQGNTLTLRHRTYRALDWVGIGFNGMYDLFVLFVVTVATLRGTWATMGWAIHPMLLIGLLWTWYSLTKLFNHTVITLNAHVLICRDVPFLSMATVHIPTYRIADVRALTAPTEATSHQPAKPIAHHVYAVLSNGSKVALMRHLDRWEEAVFVQESVTQFRRRRGF